MLTAGALSTASTQTAHAQAQLGYNVLFGNQSGTSGNFQITAASAGAEGPYVHMYTNDLSDTNQRGSINFIAGYNSNQGGIAHSFLTRSSSGGWIRNMQLLQNGQVQIGDRFPTTQTDYKLSVQGKVVAQSLYVTNPNSWADFVFEPNYKPMALPALESYLRQNKHLPYIPSATEVINNGYSTAEMDAKLLQTLEELTLQVIELSKQHKEAVTRVQKLESQLAATKSTSSVKYARK